MYGHVIIKFSGMGTLPHFLSYGVPPTLGAKRRAWSSAMNKQGGTTETGRKPSEEQYI